MHRNGTDAYSKVRGPKAGKNRSLYLPAAAGGLQMEVSCRTDNPQSRLWQQTAGRMWRLVYYGYAL